MSARSRNRNRAARPLPGVLGAQLRRLAGWAVASSLGAAIGCSGSQAEPAQVEDAGRDSAADASGRDAVAPAPERDSDWTTMPCDTLLLVTHPVRPALALDYFGVVGPKYRGASVMISDYGNPCQGASDPAACIAKLNEFIRNQAACEPGAPCPSITVTTRGDLVERQTTPKQLHAVLGEIDTKSEAAVVAMVQGIMLVCRDTSADESLGTRVRATASGYRVESQWEKCSASDGEQAVDVRRDGTASKLENTLFARSGCTIGRRPEGLELARVPQRWEPLGKFLTEVAQLEAASVFAFERLAFELQQLGAPAALSAAARESADDERRHALLTAALAHDYGGALFAPKLPAAGAPRNALALALENAVEGCVRETFGAIIAWHQASLARDERFAAVMRGIAADETRHAELSWRIAAWLEPQLSDQDRGLVGAARDAALRELEREIAMDALPDSARALIGLPSTSVQSALLDRMASQLALS